MINSKVGINFIGIFLVVSSISAVGLVAKAEPEVDFLYVCLTPIYPDNPQYSAKFLTSVRVNSDCPKGSTHFIIQSGKDTGSKLTQQEKDIAALSEKSETIYKKDSQLYQAVVDGVTESLSRDMAAKYESKLNSLEKRIQDLEAKIQNQKSNTWSIWR